METKVEQPVRKKSRGGKYAKGGKYAQKRQPRFRKQERKRNKKELWMLLIVAVLALVAVGVAMLVIDRGNTYQFRQSGRQYYGGSSAAVPAGARMKSLEDGTMELSHGDYVGQISLPVYLDGSTSLVTTKEMAYYEPRIGNCRRVLYFTNVTQDGASISFVRSSGDVRAEQGFLYDGDNFYIFMEPVTVHFNNYTFELPAMSYVEAVYGGFIMLFNYETKECVMEMSDGTGVAKADSGAFEISLLGDSMQTPDGRKTLLVSRPEIMDPITE